MSDETNVAAASPATPGTGANAVRWNPEQKLRREFVAERAKVDDDRRTVELSFSSELAVKRYDWSKDREFNEVLSHDPADVDLSRLNNAHPLLLNHDTYDQVGVVESARIDPDKKGRAIVRFSKSQKGEEIWKDVKDGIRRLVSVGYRRVKEIASETKDGLETVRFAWQPYEISLVSVPADPTVGIGRSLDLPPVDTKDNAPMPETTVDENKLRNDTAQCERKRIAEITAINQRLAGKIPGLDEECSKAIAEGTPVAELQAILFSKLPGITPVSKPVIEVPTRDLRRYSISRAIMSACDGKLDGMEKEFSDEIARTSGVKPQGFFIPPAVMYPQTRADLVAGTATLGGNLIATDLMAGSFIDMLRNKSFVVQAGARVMAGLVGTVTIPRQYSGSTAYWVAAETAAATQSDLGFDQITLSPKCLTAWVNYGKQALLQTTPAIDALVRDDINMKLALTMDLSALHSQTNGPTPISETTGITTVACGTDGGALTWAHLVSLETSIAVQNADVGTMSYMTNPKVKGALKQTSRDTVAGGFIWTDAGSINGYTARATNQVASNLTKGTATTICSAVFFGNWSDLLIGQWGGIDVVVDPYTNASTRLVRVFAHQYADMAVRHAESFAVILDALA